MDMGMYIQERRYHLEEYRLVQTQMQNFMMQQLGEKLAESFNLSSGAVHTWGTVFARYVGLSMFLTLIGALFTLIYSPLKQLMEGTPEKVWPGKL